MVRYTGRTVRGMSFASTAADGRPDYLWPGMKGGEVFQYVVGESSVNRGFDEAVADMARGEKRLAIIPSEMGYDPVGFYGREREGIPRFVIRPRSILIYEVEVLAY
jgi:FKBP-type peptidyl-prolyl cis-trans isomerase